MRQKRAKFLNFLPWIVIALIYGFEPLSTWISGWFKSLPFDLKMFIVLIPFAFSLDRERDKQIETNVDLEMRIEELEKKLKGK